MNKESGNKNVKAHHYCGEFSFFYAYSYAKKNVISALIIREAVREPFMFLQINKEFQFIILTIISSEYKLKIQEVMQGLKLTLCQF
ncbi:hypothetical protein [Peribacillus frigoritolerans]|uniref:hypothetical protein n=1 Tax=Peribacillus frigoritolerans TaxID=450367 RepID=UPI001F4FEF05|nr:hypothetical protein [Peribacillus frigoritolerans]MCK2020513.1 hypothetical protein [Peribacillus frigoritolerans]